MLNPYAVVLEDLGIRDAVAGQKKSLGAKSIISTEDMMCLLPLQSDCSEIVTEVNWPATFQRFDARATRHHHHFALIRLARRLLSVFPLLHPLASEDALNPLTDCQHDDGDHVLDQLHHPLRGAPELLVLHLAGATHETGGKAGLLLSAVCIGHFQPRWRGGEVEGVNGR